MIINKEVVEILKEYKIDKDAGILVLLGIYYSLDVDKVCPETIVKQINLTKIVERDYSVNSIITLKWNIPLFEGQQTEWDWVIKGYNAMWSKYPDRKAANGDVLKRMKEWFTRYPQYRKQDVQKATLAYHATVREGQYCKNSAKFIFEGIGAAKTSMLLAWCEKVAGTEGQQISTMKGNIIT